VEGVGLGAQTAGSRASTTLEVTAESRGKERAEDDVGATEGGQREPQEEDKLESEVKGEPVNDADKALNHGEEGEDDPVGQPLRVVGLGRGEEGTERIVGGNGETSEVGQELATEVEDDKEKVEGDEADDSIGLGNRGRLLEVVQSGVFGKLLVELTDILVHTVLRRRHGCEIG